MAEMKIGDMNNLEVLDALVASGIDRNNVGKATMFGESFVVDAYEALSAIRRAEKEGMKKRTKAHLYTVYENGRARGLQQAIADLSEAVGINTTGVMAIDEMRALEMARTMRDRLAAIDKLEPAKASDDPHSTAASPCAHPPPHRPSRRP